MPVGRWRMRTAVWFFCTFWPPAPGWLVSGRGEDPEALAFRSGAALAVLHPWIATADGGVPLALLRDRRWGPAALWSFTMLVLGLGAAFLGLILGALPGSGV